MPEGKAWGGLGSEVLRSLISVVVVASAAAFGGAVSEGRIVKMLGGVAEDDFKDRFELLEAALEKLQPVENPTPVAEPAPQPSGTIVEGFAVISGYPQGLTACGNEFSEDDVFAAHYALPCGTALRITNPINGRALDLPVWDKAGSANAWRGIVLSLSQAAARALGIQRGARRFPTRCCHPKASEALPQTEEACRSLHLLTVQADSRRCRQPRCEAAFIVRGMARCRRWSVWRRPATRRVFGVSGAAPAVAKRGRRRARTAARGGTGSRAAAASAACSRRVAGRRTRWAPRARAAGPAPSARGRS